MRFGTSIGLCAALLLANLGATPPQLPDPTCLLRSECTATGNPLLPIQNVLTVANTSNTTSLRHAYAPDAIVIDDEAPYRWNGADAGTALLDALANEFQRWKLTNFKATTVHVESIQISGPVAHIVVPAVLTGTVSNKTFRETGTFTFILTRLGSTWRISAQTWATQDRFSNGRAVLMP